MFGAVFVTQACRQFLSFWQKLGAGGSVPHSRRFLDRAPIDHIPYTCICELTPAGLFIRHMGTGLVDHWRTELTGRYLADGSGYFEADGFAHCAYVMCAHPCGLRQVGYSATAAGVTTRFESVMLPLDVDLGKPARLAAFTFFEPDIRRSRGKWRGEESFSAWIDLGHGVPNMPPQNDRRHILEMAVRDTW